MRIGAHVRRRAGGVAGAVEEARKRGADCAQVFVSNPRGWAPPRVTEDEAAAFRHAWSASGLHPLLAHAPYLLNIASANPEFLLRSRELARETLAACDALGVGYLVVHAGTGGEDGHELVIGRAAESLRAIAAGAAHTRVLIELEEGVPSASASTIPEAALLLGAAKADGIGLCLDTCHLFAAGYALDTPEGVAQVFDELRSLGLTDRLAIVHANDAMFERGGHRDRHENIGDGRIGVDGWRALMRRPEVAELAFVLETPGDAERQARDIALLRSFAR